MSTTTILSLAKILLLEIDVETLPSILVQLLEVVQHRGCGDPRLAVRDLQYAYIHDPMISQSWTTYSSWHYRYIIQHITHTRKYTTGHMTQSKITASQGRQHIKQRKSSKSNRGRTQVTPWLPTGYWLGDVPSSQSRQHTPPCRSPRETAPQSLAN